MPENTIGNASLYPGSASCAGFSTFVMVSPTNLVNSLIEPAKYPTSPQVNFLTGTLDGI